MIPTMPPSYPPSDGPGEFHPSSLPNLAPSPFLASSHLSPLPPPGSPIPPAALPSPRSHRHTTSTASAPPAVPDEGNWEEENA